MKFDPDRVLELVEQKLTRSVIAERLGTSPANVARIIEKAEAAKRQNSKATESQKPPESKVRSQPWTDEESAEAQELFDLGWRQSTIAQKLGRSVSSVSSKLHDLKREHRVHPDRIAEAAARREASYERDLTSHLMGDPPPGYSARRSHG